MRNITSRLGLLLFLVTVLTCSLRDFPLEISLVRAVVVSIIFIFLVSMSGTIFSKIIASIKNERNSQEQGNEPEAEKS